MPDTWTPSDWEPVDINLWTLGVSVTLRCWADDPDARDRLASAVRRAWGAALGEPGPTEALLDVVVTGDPVIQGAAAAAGCVTAAAVPMVLHDLSSRVTLTVIERQAGRLWMLHGAALADPISGATVALVAPSGTGKTTASRILARRFGYVTDETVGVARDLRVHAHPKPLSVVRTGTEVKDQVAPADAGLLPTPAAPTLSAVVLLRRDGTRRARLERLRTSMAIAALAPETSYLGRLPRPLSFLADILAQVGAFEAHYREAADLEPLVAGLARR
jgi:hypothetical protein